MTIENLHNELPDRLKAETCDTIQFFLRSNADQQMRFVIHLGGLLDFEVLKKAVRLTIYQEPIFSYTYQEDSNGAYWQKQREIDSALLVDCVDVIEDEQREIDKFITQASSPFDFPLVKIRLIRCKQKDVLCINMNHTPTDGAGLKEFARILSENYNGLLENPEYASRPNIGGDRGIKQVTDRFTFPQKIRFTMQGLKKPKKNPSWSFNWKKANSVNSNQFVTTKISSETFLRIKTFGKCNGYTVNDIVLAAFIRSFVRARQGNENVSKPLIIPVDLRIYKA
ncbi:MAG: hypothetical protein H6Q17_2089 [Bacteroidetes bacterium]|nr:hypothetical protein [Bacteroidota bacterium]